MATLRKWACGALATMLAVTACTLAQGVDSCGPPPPAAPQRRTGGESFPPLPLPATPLRRTEKKREPRPPSLFAKVAYGQEYELRGDKKVSWPDWKTDPSDIETLLQWANSQIGVNYGSVETTFAKFTYDPSDVPVLYLTGHNPPALTREQAERLRGYLENGGTLVADACCGSGEFRKAFEGVIKSVFPNENMRVLPGEHPVFTCFHNVREVRYVNVGSKGAAAPVVKGIDIGCRTAVFYFVRDVSCGWAGHEHPTGERYAAEDARRTGANLVAYIIANYQLGRSAGSAKVYYQSGVKSRDEFVMGQIVHEGGWDPSPSGIANLLEHADRETSITVQYKKVAVQPESAEVFNYPLLYMLGHYDFKLSESAVTRLRSFIANGGILFAEACCGRREFDTAFRREFARVLPGRQLELIELDSPVYRSFYTVDAVRYTPYAQETLKGTTRPLLEGIVVDGSLAVIYSPYAVCNGWERIDHPYGKGYESSSAFKIGTNVLVYAMSH